MRSDQRKTADPDTLGNADEARILHGIIDKSRRTEYGLTTMDPEMLSNAETFRWLQSGTDKFIRNE